MGGGRLGSGSQGLSTTPARSGQPGGTGATPALGIRYLPGDGPRLGWDVGPWMGLAQLAPWPGRTVRSWRLALLWHRWCRS